MNPDVACEQLRRIVVSRPFCSARRQLSYLRASNAACPLPAQPGPVTTGAEWPGAVGVKSWHEGITSSRGASISIPAAIPAQRRSDRRLRRSVSGCCARSVREARSDPRDRHPPAASLTTTHHDPEANLLKGIIIGRFAPLADIQLVSIASRKLPFGYRHQAW